MLTVKHIDMAGNETIYPAFTVEYKPDRTGPVGRSEGGSHDRLLAFTEDRFIVAELTGGTIYVMNDKGQTIARYDLGASPVPLEQKVA